MTQVSGLPLSFSKLSLATANCTARQLRIVHAFERCVGRLVAAPGPAMGVHVAALRAQLPRPGYTAVHLRTFGADMRIPPHSAVPDPAWTLRFLAWEHTTREGAAMAPDALARELAALCEREGRVFVASDARAAVLLVGRVCGAAAMVTMTAATGSDVRAHGERHAQLDGGGRRAAAQASGALDWTMLARAAKIVRAREPRARFAHPPVRCGAPCTASKLCCVDARVLLQVRVGGQYSSFATSAAAHGCGVRLEGVPSPHTWRYKSAASWLLGKVNHHLATGSAARVGALQLLNGTPCAGLGSLAACRQALRAAYT